VRTDLTRICVACRLRQPAASLWCSSCGRGLEPVARARLDPAPAETRSLLPLVVPVFVLAGAAAGGLLGTTFAAPPPAGLLPLLGAAVGVTVALALRGLVTWTVPAPSGVEVRLARGRPGGTSVAGTIAAERSIEAPLSGRRCVAFRLTGAAGADRVDDSDAVPFTVITAEGERVRVLSPPARVRLATEPFPVDAAARARLRPFLEARGLGADGPLRLAEGCLAEGDPVHVTGVPTRAADAPALVGAYPLELTVTSGSPMSGNRLSTPRR
jgi:hypothetical protein